MIRIEKAKKEDIPIIVPMFDQYRIFYEQASDPEGAWQFLEDRIGNDESVILIAFWNGSPAGFTQLFRAFSSISMMPIYILNDLFVYPEFRKTGIGSALLNEAKALCIESGYKGLALETAMDNPAQQLYESLGWEKDTHCFHYFWTAPLKDSS